jgi:hypothetical protein
MPSYVLACTCSDCSKFEVQVEVRCSYKEAKAALCEKCGSEMKIVPCVSMGKIIGYSEANGYGRETINYDGSNRGW